ncbi:MAG: hypothetical protein JST84_05555 [Acidobacteria bacterium]|nr:hypothetical protein [Acidobacteriota bacterium]
MSKWLELKEKIQSIPEKERRKNLVGKLAHYSRKTTETRNSLAQSSQSHRCSQSVFPEGNFQRGADQLRKAASAARTLHKKLIKQIESVETDSSEEKFRTIDEYAKAAHKSLKEQWNDLLSNRVADFEKLVKAASGANLTGSKNLTEILSRLRAQVMSPPDNEDAAKCIAADLESLKNSVSTLGLEGRVGEFLVAAAEGRGDPKDLGNPQIVAFIEGHKLWNLLSVKLR